jgi:hypothetical protein
MRKRFTVKWNKEERVVMSTNDQIDSIDIWEFWKLSRSGIQFHLDVEVWQSSKLCMGGIQLSS